MSILFIVIIPCVKIMLDVCSNVHIFRDLYACGEEGKQLAVSTFQANKQFYHSVAANQLTKDLQLS